MPQWITDSQYQALYNEGNTDSAIAVKLQCERSAVTSWRKRSGLPAIRASARTSLATLTAAENRKNRICFRHELTSLLSWRTGDVMLLTVIADGVLLIEKTEKHEPQKRKIINSDDAMALYNQGYSDQLISQELEVSIDAVYG